MISEKINTKLKQLRKDKGYSLEEISQMIPVSKQGYHMWEQGLRSWKLDTLALLSKILDFKLVIENGNIDIIQNIENYTPIKNKKEVDFNMKKFKEYEIIELYTGADNVNFDDKEILDTVLVYKDKEEAMDVFGTETLVPVYALYNYESGYVHPNTFGLDKTRAYSMYFWNYAPTLDSKNTVYLDAFKEIKVSKVYVKFDLDNPNSDGTYPVIDILNTKEDKTLGMFLITNLYGDEIPQLDKLSTDFPNIIE